MYVITSEAPNAAERFTRGKEVLTILIGVFGTILGFYYGKTDMPQQSPAATQQTTKASNNAMPAGDANGVDAAGNLENDSADDAQPGGGATGRNDREVSSPNVDDGKGGGGVAAG